MAKTLTPEEQAEAEVLLGIMADSQQKLWDAASELEKILDFDIDTTHDFEGLGLDQVIELHS